MKASFETVGTYAPDKLIAGDFPQNFKKVTIAAGQSLTRGALIGKITASGKFTLSAAAAADGSEVPTAILVDDVDATAADAEGMAYLSGTFDASAVTFGAGHTAASVEDTLRDVGIYLTNTVPG